MSFFFFYKLRKVFGDSSKRLMAVGMEMTKIYYIPAQICQIIMLFKRWLDLALHIIWLNSLSRAQDTGHVKIDVAVPWNPSTREDDLGGLLKVQG